MANTERKSKTHGALWKKKQPGGGKGFLAGSLEMPFDAKQGDKIGILVFQNTYKKQPKHPDCVIIANPPQGA